MLSVAAALSGASTPLGTFFPQFKEHLTRCAKSKTKNGGVSSKNKFLVLKKHKENKKRKTFLRRLRI